MCVCVRARARVPADSGTDGCKAKPPPLRQRPHKPRMRREQRMQLQITENIPLCSPTAAGRRPFHAPQTLLREFEFRQPYESFQALLREFESKQSGGNDHDNRHCYANKAESESDTRPVHTAEVNVCNNMHISTPPDTGPCEFHVYSRLKISVSKYH